MRSRILAIPLLAAIWVGSPAYALTTHSDARAVTRSAPELGQPTIDVRLDIITGVVAEQRDRGSRGGGSRSGGGDGNRGGGGERGVNRGDGGDRGRQSGSSARRGDGDRGGSPRVVVVPRRSSPTVVVNNYSSFRRGFYPAYRYDPWIRRSYGWSPVRYAPWGWIYGTSGLAAFSIGSGYSPYTGYGYYGPDPYYGYGGGYYNGGYSGGRPSTFDTGGVRLKVRPRDAQVFVDGYYAGLVNDFDGVFQELRLSQGGHKIEVRMPGFETAFFDVHVQPGRTIDVREDLRPQP